MPYSGTFSVGVYGSNNPDELSHGNNVTVLGTFEIKAAKNWRYTSYRYRIYL